MASASQTRATSPDTSAASPAPRRAACAANTDRTERLDGRSAQTSVSAWVRARALSVSLLVTKGSMALGALLWAPWPCMPACRPLS
ncbi:MAG TPA: MFS transporter [Candidatus Binatia bacterium]|nr:MFS transporter [Candidatus Binatia bacterium]